MEKIVWDRAWSVLANTNNEKWGMSLCYQFPWNGCIFYKKRIWRSCLRCKQSYWCIVQTKRIVLSMTLEDYRKSLVKENRELRKHLNHKYKGTSNTWRDYSGFVKQTHSPEKSSVFCASILISFTVSFVAHFIKNS